MRALQLTAPGRIELCDVPVPELGPADVLVKVAGAGLCHSDLHILHNPEPIWGRPTTLGHETAGRIAAKGDQVTGLSEGDAVLVCLVAVVLAGIIATLIRPFFALPVSIPVAAFVTLPIIGLAVGLVGSLAGLRRAVTADPARAFGGT